MVSGTGKVSTDKVKAVFIFNVIGGWNDLRNKTDVSVLRPGDPEWHTLKPVTL